MTLREKYEENWRRLFDICNRLNKEDSPLRRKSNIQQFRLLIREMGEQLEAMKGEGIR